MLPQHWLLILVAMIAGYIIGRVWTQPGDMIGLP
jgi:hypothetical protein